MLKDRQCTAEIVVVWSPWDQGPVKVVVCFLDETSTTYDSPPRLLFSLLFNMKSKIKKRIRQSEVLVLIMQQAMPFRSSAIF